MTDDEIQYKAFLVVWKSLRRNQSVYYFETEKHIKQYYDVGFIWIEIDDEIIEKQFVELYPEGIDAIVEEQKNRNLDMFLTALLATSNDRFEEAKRLNQGKIDKLRQIVAK